MKKVEAEKKARMEEIEWTMGRLRLGDGKVGGVGAAASIVPQVVTMCWFWHFFVIYYSTKILTSSFCMSMFFLQ